MTLPMIVTWKSFGHIFIFQLILNLASAIMLAN